MTLTIPPALLPFPWRDQPCSTPISQSRSRSLPQLDTTGLQRRDHLPRGGLANVTALPRRSGGMILWMQLP